MSNPVIALLNLVWENANRATSHSWERLNHGMSEALSLAIGAGFEFAEGDIKHILDNYRSGYWIGVSDEWIYGSAIVHENMSAIKSYESEKSRQPFIADDVEWPPYGRSSIFLHGTVQRRKRERLSVGVTFQFGDLRPTVTSFNDDEGYLVACTYKPHPDGNRYGHGKIHRRLKITPEQIHQDRAERKKKLVCEESK